MLRKRILQLSSAATSPYNINYLVLAGGGGAGARRGSGGGAGGLKSSFGSSGGGASALSELALTPGTQYTINIGAGGSGAAAGSDTIGAKGSDSFISGSGITTITSLGGGTGSSISTSFATITASGGLWNGGCGAGGGANHTCSTNSLGESPTQNHGNGTSGQGFDGGEGIKAHDGGGGGGGGGGGTASAGTDNSGCVNNSYGGSSQAGGNGTSISITGSGVTYGAGGSATNGIGGNSNGGGSQTANTGNGGRGNAETAGVNSGGEGGGSGVIVLRIPNASYSGTTTGSPNVDTSSVSGFTILKYTGTGTYTG